MNQQLLSELKGQLEAKKANLEQELASFAKKDEEVKGNWEARYPNIPEGDLETEADEVEEYSNRLHVEFSLEAQLKSVDEALKRMEEGAYGTCGKCGGEIHENRLRAYPEADVCEECAAQ